MFRVFLVPVFVILLLINTRQTQILGLAVFILASLTDWLDGYIARKHHLITTFGKFFDPLADKLLVCTALILLTAPPYDMFPAVMTIIVILRELTVSGFREIAAAKGVIIAAGFSGKIKTTFQMIVIIAFLAMPTLYATAIGISSIWLLAAITAYSGVEYLWKNKHVLKD